MPLQIALLHERAIAVVAVEGSLTAMHANVRLDAEQLSVSSSTSRALKQLIGSPGTLVAGEDFHITSVHTIAILLRRENVLIVSEVGVFLVLVLGEGVIEFLRL